MAGCNLSYSGHTGVINASAAVYELTTSGTTRQVRVVLQVYAIDYSGNRDGGYSVSCDQSGTYVEVPTYNGFVMNGSPQTIFDQTFSVSIERGSNKAAVSLSFSAWLISPSAGTRTISGSITQLTLTAEPAATASDVRLSVSSVQMGKKLLISIDADNSGCKHTLKYSFGGTETTLATNVGSSYEWTVPDLASKCNNATSGSCTITCTTVLNGNTLGDDTAAVTLTVQDPTTPSISGGEVTIGTASSIACKRNSANFTVKLELEFKDSKVSIGSGKQDAYSWTPGYDLAKLIPSLTSGTGTLKCTTMNGTAEVGSRSQTIRVIVPENDVTRPKFTADGLTLSPVSNLPDAFDGLYMRGKTGLTASFTATSEYSTISKYELTVGNQNATGNPASIDLLVSEGEVKVTGKVTDARGFSASVTLNIQVIPYRNPKITPYTGYADVICERAKDTGELSPDGTYLAIKAGRAYSSVLLNDKEQNSCVLHYRWKANEATSFTDWITLIADSSKETEVSLLVGNVVSSLQKSYLVEIEALDALGGKHNLTFQIMTEAVSFVLYDGPDGAGFGKYPEAPHVVDIASHMTLLVRGKMKVLGDDWISIGLANQISESAYEYGRKETGCFFLVTEGRHVHIAFNCAFAYGGTALIINDTAIPEDHRPDRTVFSPCIANDRSIAGVSVSPDGYIRVEWIQKATDTVLTGSADVTWVDGYLCYWT